MNKYVAICIDCDPDRDSSTLKWRGVRSIYQLPEDTDVPFTLALRFDNQVSGCPRPRLDEFQYLVGRYGYCLAWHFHMCDEDGGFQELTREYDASWAILRRENTIIHDGWCYGGLMQEYIDNPIVKVCYSPMPGSVGPHYDWRKSSTAHEWHNDTLLLKVPTIKTRIAKTYNHVATVHPTAPPWLFNRLIESFEKSWPTDTLIVYFHADELNGAIGGLRKYVYSKKNLLKNINTLKVKGYQFENISQSYERLRSCR